MNLSSLITSDTLIHDMFAHESEDVWARLIDRYRVPLLEFLKSKHRTDLDLELIVQDTFVDLIKNILAHKYDPEKGKFRNYLLCIATNKIRSELRSIDTRHRLEADYTADTTIANAPIPSADDQAHWHKLVYQAARDKILTSPSIGTRTKGIFIQYALQGRPAQEVAQAYDTTPNTVYQIKNRLTDLIKQEADKSQ